MPLSRRVILTLSTSIAAAAAAMVPSYGDTTFSGDARYVPNPKLPAISYKGARDNLEVALKLAIDSSQQDFGVSYTDAQKDLIRAQIWNAAQLELNRFYRPKETD